MLTQKSVQAYQDPTIVFSGASVQCLVRMHPPAISFALACLLLSVSRTAFLMLLSFCDARSSPWVGKLTTSLTARRSSHSGITGAASQRLLWMSRKR